MKPRICVQMDHQSESMRYVATATLNGKRLHEVDEYGGPEVCNEVLLAAAVNCTFVADEKCTLGTL